MELEEQLALKNAMEAGRPPVDPAEEA